VWTGSPGWSARSGEHGSIEPRSRDFDPGGPRDLGFRSDPFKRTGWFRPEYSPLAVAQRVPTYLLWRSIWCGFLGLAGLGIGIVSSARTSDSLWWTGVTLALGSAGILVSLASGIRYWRCQRT